MIWGDALLGRVKRTLVGISLSVVGGLVELVSDGILCGGGAVGKACVAILGDVLVDLLGSFGTGALDGLRNVVCGVLEGKTLAGVQASGDEADESKELGAR